MIHKADSKNEGHRKRLRTRFSQSGLNGFLDYEIIELLLAKAAINKFGGLKNTLDSSLEELQRIKGIGPSNAFGLKLFQAVSERYSQESIPKKITLDSSDLVANYLQRNIGLEKREHFVALFLDARNNLIKKSTISIGSLDSNVVHPRELFKEAIQASSAQVIIAHNHPSGDPEPSPEDIALTRRLWEAAKILGIELVDHIVVTNNKYISFKEKGLI